MELLLYTAWNCTVSPELWVLIGTAQSLENSYCGTQLAEEDGDQMQGLLLGFLALGILEPISHCSSAQNHVVAPVPQGFSWIS